MSSTGSIWNNGKNNPLDSILIAIWNYLHFETILQLRILRGRSHWMCSVEKLFLKFSQYSLKNTFAES